MSPFRGSAKKSEAPERMLTQDGHDDDDEDEAQQDDDDVIMMAPPSVDDHHDVSANAAPPSPVDSVWSSTKQDKLSPSRASEELARFFKQRADSESKNEPLSAIEEAGVAHLLQQARASPVPTAFTPQFNRVSPSPSLPNLFSPVPASPRLSSSNSLFSLQQQPASPSAGSSATASPYRRKRPVYVGAGFSTQSARRRRPAAAARQAASTITRSQSDTGVSSVAEGKRRRLDRDDDSDNAPPSFEDNPLPVASTSSGSGLTRSQTTGSLYTQSAPASMSRPGATTTSGKHQMTPARPSPLWQVSKADTPSPSPPASKTMAADIVLSVLKDTPSPTKRMATPVQNPYEGLDNPIAQINKTAKAKASTTPRKSIVPLRRSARAKSPLASMDVDSQAAPANDLELLEQSMPAEIRAATNSKARQNGLAPTNGARTTRSRTRSPSPSVVSESESAASAPRALSPPPPARRAAAKRASPQPKKVSPAPIVVLSDSSEDEDEDAVIEEPPAQPATARRSKSPSSRPAPAAATAASPFGSFSFNASAPTFSFGSTATSSSPARTAPSDASVAAAATMSSPKSKTPTSLSPPDTAFSSLPEVRQPQSQQAETKSAATEDEDEDETKARKDALATDRSKLPTFTFYSEPIFGAGSGEDRDESVQGVKELVANMGRSELPSFAF